MISDIVIFILISSTVFCQEIERAVIADGQAFQFDCRLDESIYFARQLNDWKEITENDETYVYLNLKYTHLSNENVLRVTVDSAQSKHVGFYACRKASWTSTAMSSIYQLTLAGKFFNSFFPRIELRFLKKFNRFIGRIFVTDRLVRVNERQQSISWKLPMKPMWISIVVRRLKAMKSSIFT